MTDDVQTRLDGMLAAFTPDIAARAAEAIDRLRRRLPGARVMIYDGPNALAVGFAPGDRPSDAVVSIAVYPRWLSLFFLKNGPALPDPHGLLRGSGTRARHLRLANAADLETPVVSALLDAALAIAEPPIPSGPAGDMEIRSVSPNRRPRRPPG